VFPNHGERIPTVSQYPPPPRTPSRCGATGAGEGDDQNGACGWVRALWRLIPREPAQLLHGLVGVKRIREKARVEAELIAGDLLNEERVQNDEIRRRIILRIDQERAAERARVEAMSAVEKRKARRAATYQRNKNIRRLQGAERQQNIDEARRMQEWEETERQIIDEASRMA